MKAIYFITLLTFCYSCSRNVNDLQCNVEFNGIISCTLSSDTSFYVYFDDSSLNIGMVRVYDGLYTEDWRVNEPLSMIERIRFEDNSKRELFELRYSSSGELEFSTLLIDTIPEYYRRYRIENGFEYNVLHFLPEYDTQFLSYWFNVSHSNDTSEYFYYNFNENEIEFKTDIFDFSKYNNERDSMYIEFAFKPMHKIAIDQHKGNFFPNFTDIEANMTYNSLVIHKSSQDSVGVGVLWSFFNNRSGPFSYKFLPVYGNLMLRVARYKEMADILEPKYADNRICQVAELKEKLVRIGYKIENNRVIKGKKLKQILEEVSGKRIL